MPELPDVEAVISRVRKRLLGRRIEGVDVLDKALIRGQKLRPVLGTRITDVSRRGKYILLTLKSGRTLVIHLRLTGDLLVAGARDEVTPHTRLIIRLDGGRELRFVDTRRLGVVEVVRDIRSVPGISKMGPEPLSAEFTLRSFREMLMKRTAMLKSLLMDQGFIAGIGNIYGDEILFQSGLAPTRKATELTGAEVQRLYGKIIHVLKHACEHGADLSSMRNWFVHGRAKGYCVKCRGGLKRVRVQGRYSYFCPRCQK